MKLARLDVVWEDMSGRSRARLAGLFYLLVFVTGGIAATSSTLVVPNDAAATATKILTHESLFRIGFAAYALNVACYLAVTALFYTLFKHVNASLSLVAALCSTIGCAVQAGALVFQLGALTAAQGAGELSVFSRVELQATMMLLLKLYSQSYNIGLVFFGFYCALIGSLIVRSRFLPGFIGVLMMCAGCAWLTFLWPPLATELSPYNRAIGAFGEVALTLCLLIQRVKITSPIAGSSSV